MASAYYKIGLKQEKQKMNFGYTKMTWLCPRCVGGFLQSRAVPLTRPRPARMARTSQSHPDHDKIPKKKFSCKTLL